jgi:hypothetical protein
MRKLMLAGTVASTALAMGGFCGGCGNARKGKL